MQSLWLKKQGNKDVIVFFSGWGTDETPVKHLNCEAFDVLMFFDYRNFEAEMPDFSQYSNKYLIAWSSGVHICNLFYDIFKDFDKKIAINGTPRLIDDNFGIPEAIYRLTIENFNALSCGKFMNKISSNEIFKDYTPRETEELRDELISIEKFQTEKVLTFDKAYVSKKDRIVPSKNQLNWWKSQNTEITELDAAAHSVFDLYENWSDFL